MHIQKKPVRSLPNSAVVARFCLLVYPPRGHNGRLVWQRMSARTRRPYTLLTTTAVVPQLHRVPHRLRHRFRHTSVASACGPAARSDPFRKVIGHGVRRRQTTRRNYIDGTARSFAPRPGPAPAKLAITIMSGAWRGTGGPNRL